MIQGEIEPKEGDASGENGDGRPLCDVQVSVDEVVCVSGGVGGNEAQKC